MEDELAAVHKQAHEHPESAQAFARRLEGGPGGDGGFLADAKRRLQALDSNLAACDKLIASTLAQFGYKAGGGADEDLSKGFFSTMVEIVSLVRKSTADVDMWLEQERKAAEKASKVDAKSAQAPMAVTSPDKEVDKKDQQNIFGNFRHQQQASSDDIILQLKKKMELRRLKAEATQ